MAGVNQSVTKEELAQIRAFDDFDLIMLISEIHDHGWQRARRTMRFMPGGRQAAPRPAPPPAEEG